MNNAARLLGSCLLSAALAGCSGARERALLDQFFAASRLRDLTAVHNVATVVFEPREQGSVLSYDIRSIEDVTPDSKIVTLDANVRRPDGRIVRERLRVTISGQM